MRRGSQPQTCLPGEAELVWIPTMAWAPLLLVLLMYCSGSFSQPTLTQAPSESVSLRNTVKLSCTLNSQYSSYNVGWYQQRPDQAPRFLWYGSGNKGDGVSDRFTVSSSGAIRYLTITNAQADDEATYWCAADYGSGSNFGFHSATVKWGTETKTSPALPEAVLTSELGSGQSFECPQRSCIWILACSFSPLTGPITT
ncbi:immunoglobulin omega chain-like [Alligator mississippiensis]|nr:immunoglobulin omega chain-like [Alligator mississippiensis]